MAGARMASVPTAYGMCMASVPTLGAGAKLRGSAVLTFLAFALVGPADASERFTPPEGCTPTMTVQSRGCKLSNHFVCAADAPGDQWRVDIGLYGPYFASRIDFETQWVHSVDLVNGVTSRLLPGAADPASFSELLENGTDTFDFSMLRGDGRMTRVQGFDTLTGRDVVIDGVTLRETSFEFREALQDGTFLHGAKGHEYIWPERRIFLSGVSDWTDAEGTFPRNYSPVEFDFDGDEGFMTLRPKFDCDAMMSALPAQVLPARHVAPFPTRPGGDQ